MKNRTHLGAGGDQHRDNVETTKYRSNVEWGQAMGGTYRYVGPATYQKSHNRSKCSRI
jgi:hypothetical protein